MTERSRAVFLSYASEDAEAVGRIAEALKAAGIEVWFDRSELRGGDSWDRKIRDQIHRCQLFLPIISAHSEVRDEGYFRREWALAETRTRDMSHKRAFLVPVVIDDTSERGASVPDKFLDVQWTRLPGGNTESEFVERVRGLLSGHSAPTATAPELQASPVLTPRALQAPRPTARRWRHLSLYGAIALSVLSVIGYLAYLRLHEHSILTTGALPAEKSLAVLPFVDMSERHDQEYLSDGLAEEVLTLLATIPDLQVISRTSSFQFKDRALDLRTIGAQLGAAYIVEGTVRRFGNHVRVTTQLSTSRDGIQHWSESYDSTIGDVLRMQQDIATAIARELRVEVGGAGWPAAGATADGDAYNAYLRGLHAMNRFDAVGLQEAVELFEQSINLDPGLLRARERLAQARYLQLELGSVPARVAAERLRGDIEAVLERDGNSALGHALRAELLITQDWDWARAEKEAGIAMKLGSNSSLAFYAAADVAGVMGHWDESEALFRRSLAIDPLDADTHGLMGWMLFHAGRYAESEEQSRRALAISPSRRLDHYNLGIALLAQGKLQQAKEAFEAEPMTGPRQTGLAMVYCQLGQKQRSDDALRVAKRDSADEFAYLIACAHALRGEADEAFAWLDRAYAQRDYNLEYLKGEWAFRGIFADPRYRAFLRKMNLPDTPSTP